MSEWLLLQDGVLIYAGLFFALLGGAFGLPIPEDIPLIVAGILVENGRVGLIPALIVCYTAIVVGDVVIYWAGRTFGGALFRRRWFRARGTRRRIVHMRERLQKQRFAMIFIARHLFYLRTVTFLTCGAVRVPFVDFLVSDLIAALVSVPLVVWLGHTFSENMEPLQTFLGQAQHALLFALILIVGGYALYRWRRRNPWSEAADSECEDGSDVFPISLDRSNSGEEDLTKRDANRHAK